MSIAGVGLIFIVTHLVSLPAPALGDHLFLRTLDSMEMHRKRSSGGPGITHPVAEAPAERSAFLAVVAD